MRSVANTNDVILIYVSSFAYDPVVFFFSIHYKIVNKSTKVS